MKARPQTFLLTVAGLLAAIAPMVSMGADNESIARGARLTVRDLILEIGAAPKEYKQLKLKLEGEATGKDFVTIPKTMSIDLRYDKAENQIYIKSDSVFVDGGKRSVTTYGDHDGAAKWTDRSARVEGGEPIFYAKKLKKVKALPNPWRLPIGLEFPGLFADSLHGYEALSREFARSQRMNREPDEDGLIWFDLRPAPGVASILQSEFNAGMRVKVGFVADGGWMKRMEIRYSKSDTVINFRVVEQATSLSKEDTAVFKVPDRVTEKLSRLPKPDTDKEAEAEVEPKERLLIGSRKELAPDAEPKE